MEHRWCKSVKNKIGLAIYDPRLLVVVQRKLRDFNIAFYPASESERIGENTIIIVDKIGKDIIMSKIPSKSSLIIDVNPVDVDKAIGKAILASVGLGQVVKKMIIGIDFGKNIGYAIIADGELLHYGSSPNLGYVLHKVLWFVDNIEYESLVLKIGSVSGRESEALSLASKLLTLLPYNAKIEIIDEKNSTSNKPKKFTYVKGDAKAALNIALFSREGITIER